MVDPNTGQKMGESDDIINYLWNEYGDGNVALLLKLGPLTAISNGLALLPRSVCFEPSLLPAGSGNTLDQISPACCNMHANWKPTSGPVQLQKSALQVMPRIVILSAGLLPDI